MRELALEVPSTPYSNRILSLDGSGVQAGPSLDQRQLGNCSIVQGSCSTDTRGAPGDLCLPARARDVICFVIIRLGLFF